MTFCILKRRCLLDVLVKPCLTIIETQLSPRKGEYELPLVMVIILVILLAVVAVILVVVVVVILVAVGIEFLRVAI